MYSSKDDELRAIKGKIATTQVIGTTGAILLGLGLHSLLGGNGDFLHPLLKNHE
jgi:hypothetical protein